MNKAKTFETTYTRYPFAPLVKRGVDAAAWLKRVFGKARVAGNDGRHGGVGTGVVGHAA
jgi:hypothetical protein